ncbi:MAG: metal ABC transporter permease [Deinococcales bacterium]
MGDIVAFLSDFTIRNVLLGAALLGISSGVLGSFAVLRQQSLLGDTLSHAALPGVCLAFMVTGSRQLFSTMLGALIAGSLAALIISVLTWRSRLKQDAAQGIVLSSFFALGIVLLTAISKQNNASQAGLKHFLFGQAAAILPEDVMLMTLLTALALLIVYIFWRAFKLISFDRAFAASLGLPLNSLEMLLSGLIALAIVIGLQLVGVVLMAAMIIAPASAARQWVRRLEPMILLASLFGMLSGILGALLSSLGKGLATGPLIVLVASFFVLISLMFAPERGILWARLKQLQEQRNLREKQVLYDLYQLSLNHDDPSYPSELGMLRSYYGFNVKNALKGLLAKDWVRPEKHMPEEGLHYVLSERGYQEAKRFADSFADGFMVDERLV